MKCHSCLINTMLHYCVWIWLGERDIERNERDMVCHILYMFHILCYFIRETDNKMLFMKSGELHFNKKIRVRIKSKMHRYRVKVKVMVWIKLDAESNSNIHTGLCVPNQGCRRGKKIFLNCYLQKSNALRLNINRFCGQPCLNYVIMWWRSLW